MSGEAGKGDKPRNCFSKEYWENFDEINWSTDYIEDGFGMRLSTRCPDCGKNTMQIVRPGKAQCVNCS